MRLRHFAASLLLTFVVASSAVTGAPALTASQSRQASWTDPLGFAKDDFASPLGLNGTLQLDGPDAGAMIWDSGGGLEYGWCKGPEVVLYLWATTNYLTSTPLKAVYYQVDGGSTQTITCWGEYVCEAYIPVSGETRADQPHVVVVWAEDTEGRIGPSASERVFIDHTPPLISYTACSAWPNRDPSRATVSVWGLVIDVHSGLWVGSGEPVLYRIIRKDGTELACGTVLLSSMSTVAPGHWEFHISTTVDLTPPREALVQIFARDKAWNCKDYWGETIVWTRTLQLRTRTAVMGVRA